MSSLLMEGDTVGFMGTLPRSKYRLGVLRRNGHVPEAVKVGRYFAYPRDQLGDIKQRLIQQGHLRETDFRSGDTAHA